MTTITPLPDLHKTAAQHLVFRIAAGETNKFVLLVDPTTDGVDFVQVIEIFDVDGETPPNAHRAAHETFVVLYGQGIAITDAGQIPLQPGATLLVRPGGTHIVKNTGSTRLYCLTSMIPDEAFATLIRSGVPDALDEEDLIALGWQR
jgi:mannose-6-phosphate isomerase-like protein (cupin superfamily)